jgi:hypothetical protein
LRKGGKIIGNRPLQSVTTAQNKISPKQDEVFVSFETAGPKVFGGLAQPPNHSDVLRVKDQGVPRLPDVPEDD